MSPLGCCTNCCTDASLNPLKCTKTDAHLLYFTTTYARLGLFVIGRSWVQLPLSAPNSFNVLTGFRSLSRFGRGFLLPICCPIDSLLQLAQGLIPGPAILQDD